jgi:hypothetical protein
VTEVCGNRKQLSFRGDSESDPRICLKYRSCCHANCVSPGPAADLQNNRSTVTVITVQRFLSARTGTELEFKYSLRFPGRVQARAACREAPIRARAVTVLRRVPDEPKSELR